MLRIRGGGQVPWSQGRPAALLIISNHIESYYASAFLALALCIHAFIALLRCLSQVSPGSWSRSLRIRWRACARPSGAQSFFRLRWLWCCLCKKSRFAPSSWIRVPCWTAHDHEIFMFDNRTYVGRSMSKVPFRGEEDEAVIFQSSLWNHKKLPAALAIGHSHWISTSNCQIW